MNSLLPKALDEMTKGAGGEHSGADAHSKLHIVVTDNQDVPVAGCCVSGELPSYLMWSNRATLPRSNDAATIISSRASAIHFGACIRREETQFVGQHFWARGYFVSTVGRDEAVIREYIRKQEPAVLPLRPRLRIASQPINITGHPSSHRAVGSPCWSRGPRRSRHARSG